MKRAVVFSFLACSVGLFQGCTLLGLTNSEVRGAIRKLLGGPDNPYLKPIPESPPEYRAAFDHLEARRWAEAEQGFSGFLKKQPSTNWTLAAQFNWGRAIEAQGRHGEALEKYREVEQKGRLAPRVQGLALVRMAVMLEALGEDEQSLAALKDAEKRATAVGPEVAQAEIPARLASAYARAGNMAEAEKYYSLADKALGRLRVDSAREGRPEWLARVLYSMGHRPAQAIEWNRFDDAVVSVERSQRYLVQAAELEEEPWATLAVENLLQSYAELRRSADSAPVPASSEILIAARDQQRARWQRLVRLSDALAKLKSLFVTELLKGSDANRPIVKLYQEVDQLEESLVAALMFERPAGEVQTEESRSRRLKSVRPEPAFPGEGEN